MSKSISAMKSRSDTASSEFANVVAKPISLADTSGLMGNDDPARAPAPNGETSSRCKVSARREASRNSDQLCARK